MVSIFDVANYFLSLQDPDDDDGISNLKMQKLCYYAQGIYLALHNKRLFKANMEAWQHGPVFPVLYQKYKSSGSHCLIIDSEFDINSIPADIKSFLDAVYAYYGQFSAWKLRDMTHHEAPWINSYNKTDNDEISDTELKRFFKTLLD